MPILLTLALLPYLVAIYMCAKKKGIPRLEVTLSHLAPTLTAIVLFGFFVIGGAATTVQFNAGSESAMDLWSAWVGLWPLMLLLNAFWIGMNLLWMAASLSRKGSRRYVNAIGLASMGMSALAFLAVGSTFPSA